MKVKESISKQKFTFVSYLQNGVRAFDIYGLTNEILFPNQS